jgi:predicted nucleic acid-binding protein
MITVLYDTNIILDVLMQRQPFYVNSTLALSLSGREIVHGYIAGHAVTTIDYILQKQVGHHQSRQAISCLLEKLQVAPITESVIRQGLNTNYRDFEDAITYLAALAVGAQIIVARNIKDFPLDREIDVLLPEQILTMK